MRPGAWVLAISGGLALMLGLMIVDSLGLNRRGVAAARLVFSTIFFAVFSVVLNRYLKGR